MAADVGGDVMLAELLLDELHRGEDRPLRTAGAEARRPHRHRPWRAPGYRRVGRRRVGRAQRGRTASPAHARAGMSQCRRACTWPVYSPAIGRGPLPTSFVAAAGLVEHRAEGLLDIVGLAFLDDQHRVLVVAEVDELVVDQRIGDVEHIERHFGLAIEVGEAETLQGADHAIVHAALHDDADAAVRRGRRTR